MQLNVNRPWVGGALPKNGEASGSLGVQELEFFFLKPDEPNVDLTHIAFHARGLADQVGPHLPGRDGTESG